MDKQEKFRESLTLLLSLAEASEGELTQEQVKGAFQELALSQEQWELIYHYLELNRVVIRGHEMDPAYLKHFAGQETAAEEMTPSGLEESEKPWQEAADFRRPVFEDVLATQPSEEEELWPEEDEEAFDEESFLLAYRAELGALLPLLPEECEELLELMRQGEESARERLIEGHLALALSVAEEFTEETMAEADLIQEANLALMFALNEYEGGVTGLTSFLAERIRRTLQERIAEENGDEDMEAYFAAQANALLHISSEFAEENGREPTLVELSERMGMPQEVLRELMKMSLDALNGLETEER